jgi:hypothetical protein
MTNNIEDDDEVLIECICGEIWYLEFDPTPVNCVGQTWRLGVQTKDDGIYWAHWIDNEGHPVANLNTED